MIPKIIHLCWFGRGKYSELIEECLESWKNKLPEYEIRLWNEDTFDINSTTFTKQAYENKKWAFVSDYVRLYALYKYGGIYMDTDVQVIKDFSPLLEGNEYVSSFVEGRLLATAFIASTNQHPFIKALLDYYNKTPFINEDGTFNMTMNPLIFTKIGVKLYGIDITKKDFFNEKMAIYSMDYFMPFVKNNVNGKWKDLQNYNITTNTYTIHHDNGSWDPNDKFRPLKNHFRKIVGSQIYDYLKFRKNMREIKKIQI